MVPRQQSRDSYGNEDYHPTKVRPSSGIQSQHHSNVISQIESQFKEELNKFKGEMSGHK